MDYEELKKTIVAYIKLAKESLVEANKREILTGSIEESSIIKIANVLLEQRILRNIDSQDLRQK